MRQQQQRRVVALAIALASKCTFTGQISIGDVTVYCQGGHINGGALLAILFPTSAGALEKLAHQWNVDLTNTPLIVVAMLVHRVTRLMKSESMKTISFGRDAIRLCLKMLSEAMRASPTWLLQTPPANALLSFTFHSGRSCTRLEPRARAMNMLAAGAKDLRGRRSREAGIENLLYLKQAQELFKMSFEKFHTLSVVLDAASFRNAHILQIFAAALLDDAHSCGAALPPQILPELHCGGPAKVPIRIAQIGRLSKPAGDPLMSTWEVCAGVHQALGAITKHGLSIFLPATPPRPPPYHSKCNYMVQRRRGGDAPAPPRGEKAQSLLTDGPLDHRSCGGQVKTVMHLEGQEVIKTILND